jgi:hypothetical protein
MTCSKEGMKFYMGFPQAAENKIRDLGPSHLSAEDLANMVPVRDLVALALANGIVKPNAEPGIACVFVKV